MKTSESANIIGGYRAKKLVLHENKVKESSSVHLHDILSSLVICEAIMSPRHLCAARVTVLSLCVPQPVFFNISLFTCLFLSLTILSVVEG